MRPVFAFILTTLVAASAAADIVIPHMGRLLSGDGASDAPVDGLRKLRFSIHTKSIDAQGENNLVWEETYSGVDVNQGFYRVELGDTSGGRAPIVADDLLVSPTLWLEITVYENDEATNGVTLSPRMRLSPSFGANFAYDALRLGGSPSSDFLKKEEFEEFRTELTGGGEHGLAIPWNRLTGLPEGFADGTDDGITQVTVGGTALTGDGTGSNPLLLKEGGIEARHLQNGAVTAEKLAPGAVTPDVFVDGSMSPEKIELCKEGEILKIQSGRWQCGVDTGAGGTLTFNVLLPIEQIPGTGGGAATVQIKDGGIEAVKLADAAVTSAKLAPDVASLGRLTNGAATTAGSGAVGVGVANPNARLEVGAWTTAGVTGVGTVDYAQNTTTVKLESGDFRPQVRPGDLIQLGNLGWRTVTAVSNATTLSIDSGYTATFNGRFSIRRATLRTGALTETGLGNVGVGTQTPAARLHVAGDTLVTGTSTTSDLVINRNGNARLYTGTATTDQGRYLEVLNSPNANSASGLKTGGLLVADDFSHASPGKSDAVIKGNLRVDGLIRNAEFIAQAMCGVMNTAFDYGRAYKAPAQQTCATFCASVEDGKCVGGMLVNGGAQTARYDCNFSPASQYDSANYCCCR